MESFKEFINKALKRYSPKELGSKLRISVPTIKRWASGKNEPHPLMMKSIIEILEGDLK